MVNYGIYSSWDDRRDRGGRRIREGGSVKVVKISLSALLGRARKQGTVSAIIKSNFLRTRGTNRGKLLNPQKQFGKIKAHINYVGRRALDKTFYNEEGKEVSKEKVWEEIKEKNPFIVHRTVISPSRDLKDEQFKALVKYEMGALKERLDERKDFDYFYAKHGGRHPHAHVILYSNNQFFIKKEDLKLMRENANEFMQQLEKGKVLQPELTKEIEVKKEKEMEMEL